MQFKQLFFLVMLSGLFVVGNASVVLAAPEPKLLLEDAVAIALADNPGLAAMKTRAEALAAVPSQQGSLPDPRLSLNMVNLPLDSFDLTQEGMTQLQVGFSQMLPFPGKLALREAAAVHESTAARWQVEELRLKLVRDVKTVWWNLYFTDRALEIVARNVELLRQFVDVAQTKYKVGKGLQQDVLLAQLELSKLHDQTINLRGLRRNQVAQLNALLDEPTDSPLQLPQRIMETLVEITDEKGLLAHARKTRPVLAASQSKIDAARARLSLAKKSYSPDFKLGAVYGYRGGENLDGSSRADFLSVMFSMNLPIYAGARQDKAVDQRTSQVLQNQYQLDDAHSKVAAEVSRALADYQRSREQASLFKQGIIPQAAQTVASMLAAYQVNKVDFLNLVRAQITLFNYETRYWKALSQGNQALARLTAATGKQNLFDDNGKNNWN
ncbi:MAG TPA: TolC family protein [Gammaproteobacteria bacterium]|nr:TolC family protein [Gammaproteobacteria bacterium]